MNCVVCIVGKKRDSVELRINMVKNNVVYDDSPCAKVVQVLRIGFNYVPNGCFIIFHLD
jgi:hypothetical protein